jgi:SAM-dependent methyltransferase
MESDSDTPVARQIGNRIRQRLSRRDAAPERVDLEMPRLARLGETEGERLEEQALDSDLPQLHETFSVVELPLTRAPRRGAGSVIASARRVSFRMISPLLDRQSAFNGGVARSLTTLRNRTLRQQDALQKTIDTLSDALAPAVRQQARALQQLERRIHLLERHSRDGRPTGGLDEYEFANRFRGTEDSLRDRQRQYVELFTSVVGKVLDFGCGRGEFLELLGDAGIPAHGVDLDRRMVEHCQSKGLSAELREGLAYLEGLPPSSLGGIFASQVVEHFDLSSLLSLLRLARRVLTPGGVLVLETHNPQTLLTFPLYTIDPTHVRLYHSETVVWLLEQEGFVNVEVRFGDPAMKGFDADLAESDGEQGRLVEILTSVLHGYLTYAAVGRSPSG